MELQPTLTLQHGTGTGDMQFSPDGSLLITTGQDARICVLETANAITNATEELIGECDSGDPITALQVYQVKSSTNSFANNYEIITANENRIVSTYSCTGNQQVYVEQIKTFGKYSLAPCAVDVSPKDGTIAYSGGDSDIHLAFPGAEVETMAGCRPDVVGLCFDPKGEYLASASTSGHVRVFKIATKDQIKLFDNQLPTTAQVNGEACTRWRPSWHPEGSLLALPGAKSIKLIKRGTWSTAAMLTNGHLYPVTLTCWSNNGVYVASADTSGKVVVWELKTRKPIKVCEFPTGVQSLSFCPAGNLLAVLTTEGEYSLLNNIIPSNMKQPSSLVLPEVGALTKGEPRKDAAVVEVAVAEKVVAATAEDKKVGSTKKATKTKTKKHVRIVAPGDDDDDDEDDDLILASSTSKKNSAKKKKSSLMDDEDEDDDDEMIDGDIAALKAKFSGPTTNVMDVVPEETTDTAPRTIIQQAPETAMQDVFQPGATYPRAGVKRRFLCMNLLGSITTREDDGYNAIEITFSDSSQRRPVRMADNYDFGVAALGSCGALFASQIQSDANIRHQTTTSTLFYKPFEAWAHNSEWTMSLPKGDSVECVAVGDHWCAASTSSGFVRCFRSSGLQLTPMLSPGPVVAMAASGSSLVVVYHKGSPMSPAQGGTQQLGFVLYDVDTNPSNPLSCVGLVPRETTRGNLPLAGTDNLLEWIGFDEMQRLYSFDSQGRLFCLSPNDLKTWMLSMDTKNSRDPKATLRSNEEAHWIVGISRGHAMSTVCKGREKVDRQPRTSPKPLLTQIALGSGLLLQRGNGGSNGGADQLSMLEGKFLRKATAYSQQRRYEQETEASMLSGSMLVKAQAVLDRENLQLMQSCLKSENSTMALDLASRLHLEKSFVIAMKLARTMNQETLATKMYELMQMRMEAILKVHQDQVDAASAAVAVPVAAPMAVVEEDVTMSDANAPSPSSSSASVFGKNLKRKRTLAAKTKATKTKVETTPKDKKDAELEPPSKKKTTRKPPVNPFLKTSMASPQKKVGSSVGDSLSNVAASPTPSKPKLGRQSSFHAKTLSKRENHF